MVLQREIAYGGSRYCMPLQESGLSARSLRLESCSSLVQHKNALSEMPLKNFVRVLSFQNVKETAIGGSLGGVTAKTASGAGSSLAVLALLSQTYVTPPFSQPKAAGLPATNRVVLGPQATKQSGLNARVSLRLLGETRQWRSSSFCTTQNGHDPKWS